MEEEFRDIEDYLGLYQISNKGRVKSLKRPWVKTDNILNPHVGSNGYQEVGLSKGSPRIQENHRIHRLVACHFLIKEKGKDSINHIDGDKDNNSVENLEWCTRSYNTSHAWNSGLIDQKGAGSILSKLTTEDVLYIRKNKGLNRKSLAKKYGVCRQTIDNVINHKTY